MPEILISFLALIPTDKQTLIKKQNSLKLSKKVSDASVRVSINYMLRDLLYIHSSKTKDNVSNILLWITDDTTNDEWLALLSSEVMPYFNDNNIFNYLGE